MIDEYQDVNAVQEYIFTAISKKSENIFMVGDVKQSIYRFRLADPTIFLSKYDKFDEFGNNSYPNSIVNGKGKKIHLSRNFRSHGGILKVVNHIFRNLMSKEFGELEYTEKEWLVPGRALMQGKQGKEGKQGGEHEERSANKKEKEQSVGSKLGDSADLKDENRLKGEVELKSEAISITKALEVKENGISVEIDILDMSTFEIDGEEESPTAIRVEAEYIAKKIKKLISEKYRVPDEDGGERSIQYSDIVVLLRSIKGRAWQYASALNELDIPIEFPGGEGYFETAEVTAALSLLSVIDNPMQDIPLASVMSGLLYGFTPDEFAELRANAPSKDFYCLLKGSVECETVSHETSLKCKKMLLDLDELRSVSLDMSSDRFIWHMYNRSGLLDLVSCMRGGEKKRNNLVLLAESARHFEKNGYKGVFGFLRYIRNLQGRGIELADGAYGKSSSSENANSVKIMSIHKSKGLEFPVVILANASKQTNFQDIRKNVVFHTDLGLGAMITDKKRRIRYTTLARSAIQSKLNSEMMSEELRVLYVALTRAKEKMIVTAALKDAKRMKERLEEIPEGVVSSQTALALKSMIEWILVGVRGVEDEELLIRYLVADTNESKPYSTSSEAPIDVNIPIYDNEADRTQKTVFSYPYEPAVDLPSKLTVTGLKTLLDPDAEIAPWARDSMKESSPFSSPLFIHGKREMTAVERGILLHFIMQHIDYKKCSLEHNKEYAAKGLQRLRNEGLLTEEQIKEVDINKITRLLSSTLGGRMISAEVLKKEFKFSILRPAEIYFPGGGTDKILLQGVVDCYFEEADEIVVVDFKTDRVTEKTVDKIAQQYSQQLNTYADALHHITGKYVKEKIIYFFAIDRAYTLV
jgi:ATP-dependent helicase/nuclease subunit A